MKKFKIRSSASGKIAEGRIGLTEVQENDLFKLENKPKARTDLQEIKYQDLI